MNKLTWKSEQNLLSNRCFHSHFYAFLWSPLHATSCCFIQRKWRSTYWSTLDNNCLDEFLNFDVSNYFFPNSTGPPPPPPLPPFIRKVGKSLGLELRFILLRGLVSRFKVELGIKILSGWLSRFIMVVGGACVPSNSLWLSSKFYSKFGYQVCS